MKTALWCRSLRVKIDDRIARQLIYHVCSAVVSSPEISDSIKSVKHLRDHHPELWNRLLKMQSDQRVVRPNSFGFDLNLLDYENNFDVDDRQVTWDDLRGMEMLEGME